MNKNILITGAAGFIGMHTAHKLIQNNFNVFGIDNLNDYYDPELKKSRLAILEKYENFFFEKVDIADQKKMYGVFDKFKPTIVIHLAAQAGVRYSIDNPNVYLKSNLEGFLNILECSRASKIEHLIYASSSSVYGLTESEI